MNQNSIPIFNAFIFAKFKLKEKKNMHRQPRALPSLRLSLSLSLPLCDTDASIILGSQIAGEEGGVLLVHAGKYINNNFIIKIAY